jgi:hypothetical protein
LQERGDDKAGEGSKETILQRASQKAPQIGSEGSDDAAVDHVQAPQQQRHAAHEIEEDHAAQLFLLSFQTLIMGADSASSTGHLVI